MRRVVRLRGAPERRLDPTNVLALCGVCHARRTGRGARLAGWALVALGIEAMPSPEGVSLYASSSGRFNDDIGLRMTPDEALNVAFALLRPAFFVAAHTTADEAAPGAVPPATEAG